MRSLFCFTLLFFSCALFSQKKDSTNRDRTLEGVHLKSSCIVDTSLVFHKNAAFVIKDSSTMSYEFVTGTKSFIEVKLRSTLCQCVDCSFCHHLIIDVTGYEKLTNLKLVDANTTWISWNSMMIPTMANSFSGTLSLVNGNLITMEIFRFLPSNPEIVYDGIRVRKKIAE